MTLRNIGNIMDAPKLNEKIQFELQEYQQLNYDAFAHEFARIAVSYDSFTMLCSNNFFSQCAEMPQYLSNFIESCLPYIRSQWKEIQLQAIQLIGLLHHHGLNASIDEEKERNDLEVTSSEKIIQCLKDEQTAMRVKAAEALGNIFSEP